MGDLILKLIKRTKIKTKIIVTYAIILATCLLLANFSFSKISDHIVSQEVEHMSKQTLSSIDRNLEIIINHIKEISDVFFFEPELQDILTQINSDVIDSKVQTNIRKRLTNMTLFVDFISSVFIIDNYDNMYYSSYRSERFVPHPLGQEFMDWYDRVNEFSGDMVIVPNAGGFLIRTDSNESYISIINNIVSLDNYEKLGTSIININEGLLQEYFAGLTKEFGGEFFITDQKNKFIVRPQGIGMLLEPEIFCELDYDENKLIKLEGEDYLLSKIPSHIEDWIIYSIMPTTVASTSLTSEGLFLFAIIIIMTICIFFCTFFLGRLIFVPLNKLQGYMKQVEKGQFDKIEVDCDVDDEMNDLKKGFNTMVDSIEGLFGAIEQEQKLIRKAELDVIQAQINPHFLYNTLDAINVLTLIGDTENANKMVSALGKFYRNSLNSGRDLISIREEIECIESYVTILNVRYDDKIDLTLDIEEEILHLKILKLILQPLVENAVYHGIRNKHGKGKIKIEGYRDEDEVIFIVSDDGVGISEENIELILNNKLNPKQGGFGVYSCIQRVAIFYGIKKPMTIVSEVDNGTEITIRFKVLEG